MGVTQFVIVGVGSSSCADAVEQKSRALNARGIGDFIALKVGISLWPAEKLLYVSREPVSRCLVLLPMCILCRVDRRTIYV